MKNKILASIICSFLYIICYSQTIYNYTLNIDKNNQSEANLHINCSFTLDLQNSDSISMKFGGDEKLSIENLQVKTNNSLHISYYYNSALKEITFYKCKDKTLSIIMDYNYTNLSSFFIYGEGSAELWETSFGEYFYPHIPNTNMDATMNIIVPDSLSLICSYPLMFINSGKYSGKLKNILSQSITLAFIQNDVYHKTTEFLPNEISIYQIKGKECSDKRYKELLQLTKASIDYFNNIYDEDYISIERNITTFPNFLFHDGKGFSNRYNIGFISASQEKFSTYPDIYPLVHEIGHRWLGEWTLLINDGEPGAYFIKESLNEFMTLMFIRHFYGTELYMVQIERCKSEYNKIKGTQLDVPIVNIVVNNNNTIVYRKGPIILDHIANKIGYEKLIHIISIFYQEYAGKYPLKCSDFIDLVSKYYPNIKELLYN